MPQFDCLEGQDGVAVICSCWLGRASLLDDWTACLDGVQRCLCIQLLIVTLTLGKPEMLSSKP